MGGRKMGNKHFSDFDRAVLCMLEDDGFGEAMFFDLLTADQKDRFNKIKSIYLDECLKDCDF